MGLSLHRDGGAVVRDARGLEGPGLSKIRHRGKVSTAESHHQQEPEKLNSQSGRIWRLLVAGLNDTRLQFNQRGNFNRPITGLTIVNNNILCAWKLLR